MIDMKKYFDYLDVLRETEVVNMYCAAPFLLEEFPELFGNKETARKILNAWMSGFGKTHLRKDGFESPEKAEALFLFGDFLSSLAVSMADEETGMKCKICKRSGSDACDDPLAPCKTGIEEYLLEKAEEYHAQMEAACKNYFAYLDQLQARGGYTLHAAEDALKEDFPWLASHDGHAKYVMASWLFKYWG